MRLTCRALALSLAAALAAALLAGCGRPAASRTLPLAAASLTPYTAVYALSGPNRGTATWTVGAAGAGGVPVTLAMRLAATTETDSVVLAPQGLALRTVQEDIHAASGTVTIAAHLSGSQLVEQAVVKGHPENVTIPLHDPWLANASLLLQISGVPLAPGQAATVNDVLLKRAKSAPLALSVGGGVSVTTPAGTFRSFPVTLSAGGAVQTAWYMAAAPHAMVRYKNGAETYTLSSVSQ